MNPSREPGWSRREVFRGMLRYLTLGAVSAVSAGLIAAGRSSHNDRCRRRPCCHACPALAACQRPAAVALRNRDEG